MKKNMFKIIQKLFMYIIIEVALLFLISIIIKYFTSYELNNILFIEGLISFMIVLFSSISGSPMGLSMQSLGQTNAQYNANLQIEKVNTPPLVEVGLLLL